MMCRKSTIGLVVTLALLSTGTVVMGQSSEVLYGAWRQNLAKSYNSNLAPPNRSFIIKYEPAEGGFKETVDTVTPEGQATQTVFSGRFDGKDSTVQGGQPPTTRAYKRIDDHTWEYVQKFDGRAGITRRFVISRDGKTLTIMSTGKDVQGQPVNVLNVLDKQ